MYSAIGDKEQAVNAIRQIIRLKQRSAPGYARVPWEKIYFQLGTIQFWYNDLDDALENMQRVTSSPQELDLNTGVLAWMRIGQIYDLKRSRPLALEAYKKAIAFAPQAEAARESRRYLSASYRREKN
jgi:tetratricopeptide (TPR) repeat protein